MFKTTTESIQLKLLRARKPYKMICSVIMVQSWSRVAASSHSEQNSKGFTCTLEAVREILQTTADYSRQQRNHEAAFKDKAVNTGSTPFEPEQQQTQRTMVYFCARSGLLENGYSATVYAQWCTPNTRSWSVCERAGRHTDACIAFMRIHRQRKGLLTS